jgi:ParB/RepB/Spo0J family partition protein
LSHTTRMKDHAMTTQSLEQLPITAIFESADNPRKTYCEVALRELADTIEQVGIQQPIKVRVMPLMGDDSHFTYEIIFGHRRYRAAKLAGLEFVPCLVVDMDDETAAKVRLIENIQRDDVTPIEEAESIKRMMKQFGMTADQVGAQLGMKRTTVYNKLKLLDLSEVPRKACLEGIIGPELAARIARHPKSLQAKALERILVPVTDTRPGFEGKTRKVAMPNAQALPILKTNFIKSLAQASWPLDATHLQAPACTQCDNCSDVNEFIREDIGAGNCTDMDCFAAKGKSWIDFLVEDAKAQGKRVFEGKEALDICPSGYTFSLNGWEAVANIEADKPGHDGKHLSFEELCEAATKAGATPPEPAMLVLPPDRQRTGSANRITWIVKDTEVNALIDIVEKAYASEHPQEQAEGETQGQDEGEDQGPAKLPASLRERQAALRDTRPPHVIAALGQWPRISAEIAEAIKQTERTTDDVRLIVLTLVRSHLFEAEELPPVVMDAFGWTQEDIDDFEALPTTLHPNEIEAFVTHKMSDMSPDDIARLALIMCVSTLGTCFNSGHERLKVCDRYGINPIKPEPEATTAKAEQASSFQAA